MHEDSNNKNNDNLETVNMYERVTESFQVRTSDYLDQRNHSYMCFMKHKRLFSVFYWKLN